MSINNSLDKYIPSLTYITKLFSLDNIPFFFKQKNLGSSVINNYFLSNVISRLSAVLNLASKRQVIINDYKFLKL